MTPSDRAERSRRALGPHLGRKDAEHISRWVRAGSAAAASPKRRCEGVIKTPPFRQCKRSALTHGTCCPSHTPLREFVAIDALRRPELLHIAQTSTWEPGRRAAQAALRAMDRRALQFQWVYLDPRAPGATIQFAREADRERCAAWLSSMGFSLDRPSSISKEHPTARCIDRSLWAAARHLLKGNISEAKALISVRRAHRDDARFFAKLALLSAKAPQEASQLRKQGIKP